MAMRLPKDLKHRLLEAQKRETNAYWAEELQRKNFTVSLTKDNRLRAKCKSCGKVFEGGRPAFAADHFDKNQCPGKVPPESERGSAGSAPFVGQVVELLVSSYDGKKTRLLAEVKEVGPEEEEEA